MKRKWYHALPGRASGHLQLNSLLVLILLLTVVLGSTGLVLLAAFLPRALLPPPMLRTVTVILCALYMGAIAVYLLAVYLPVRRLTRVMQQMVDGSMDDLLGESSDRELVGAPKEFQAFLATIRRIIRNEYSTQLLKKRAELNALQSQINPHFLYNTIDSIRGQAILEGAPAIAETARALASIFRYCIDNHHNMVTLREELEHVSNYFAIQQYRFRDRFSLQIDLEEGRPELLDCPLPKLTIQPLVENAISHGLEPKMGSGTVRIQVRATQSRLILRVEDDGVGIPAEQLARIQEALRQNDRQLLGEDGKKPSSNRFALLNVHERLHFTFGERYGLRLYSTYGVGTQCEVILPLLPADGEAELPPLGYAG